MKHYTERRLEDHLEARLKEHGYKSPHYTEVDRQLCLLPDELITFIKSTQQKTYEKLKKVYQEDTDRKLQHRVTNEIGKRGIVDVLRKGIKDRGCFFSLVYFQPKSGLNPEHSERYKKNLFSLVRQYHFSRDNEQSIDVVLHLNGIPIITIELKNHFTKQTVADAKKQYNNRNHKEIIFQFKRCLVHFAVDNDQVFMSTRLSKKSKWFPYNKGIQNPIPASGHRVEYFWDEILRKDSLLDIIENFVMVVEESDVEFDPKIGKVVQKKFEVLIFPRYHQLDAIRNIRKSITEHGVGKNFLVQHTTGAGKSYEIGWLSHVLSSLYQNREATHRMFDSIIVLTDRRVLDKQLQKTIKSLEQTSGVVNPVDKTSRQLREFLEKGKDIIITTVQKFPVISNAIGELRSKNFAIVIDEVHSSQSGDTSKHVKKALSKGIVDIEIQEDEDYDDFDARLLAEIKARGKQDNISYFGFTGTPKGKTLELFGEKILEDGVVKFVPFHTYTMRQSIAEGFTLDVLAHYSTYQRYFKLLKKIKEDDREVAKSEVTRQLINYVDIQSHTIREKVKVMLDHFMHKTSKKINGRGRAMVVTRSRLHCVKVMLEMQKQMKAMHLPYSCLCGFSGTVTDPDTQKSYTERELNGLEPKVSIPFGLKDPRFRILIVANKFQTGFDEPMLHTMFVDKKLSGLQCVQTLSRLNRTMRGKTDTFVLDFVNKPEEIQKAFQQYFQSTFLEGETEPNRLYDLEREIKDFNLFTEYEIDEFIKIFYDEKIPDEKFMPIIERVIDKYKEIEEEEQQDLFKSKSQSYIRLYSYIAQIANFEDIDLEKLYIFIKYVNKKLPKREQEDVSDILDAVDLDSFRIAETWKGNIGLATEDGGLEGLTVSEGKTPYVPEKDLLSEIIKVLNETYGIDMTDEHKIHMKNVAKRLEENEAIQESFEGDNSESNRKFIFQKVLDEIFLSYVNDNFDFYKKITQGKQKDFIGEVLYQNFKQRYEQGGGVG